MKNIEPGSAFKKAVRKVPLEIRIRVGLTLKIIDVLCDERDWKPTSEYCEELDKIHQLAAKLAREETKIIMKSIKQWEADGCPE